MSEVLGNHYGKRVIDGTPEPVGHMRIDRGTLLAWYDTPNLWRRFWYWALLGWTWEPKP